MKCCEAMVCVHGGSRSSLLFVCFERDVVHPCCLVRLVLYITQLQDDYVF